MSAIPPSPPNVAKETDGMTHTMDLNSAESAGSRMDAKPSSIKKLSSSGLGDNDKTKGVDSKLPLLKKTLRFSTF